MATLVFVWPIKLACAKFEFHLRSHGFYVNMLVTAELIAALTRKMQWLLTCNSAVKLWHFTGSGRNGIHWTKQLHSPRRPRCQHLGRKESNLQSRRFRACRVDRRRRIQRKSRCERFKTFCFHAWLSRSAWDYATATFRRFSHTSMGTFKRWQ